MKPGKAKTRTPVTTRRGDGGYTSLWGGEEVAKYDLRPEAYGSIDEAAAVLGQARTATRHEPVRQHILLLQKDLFRLTSELAAGSSMAGQYQITADNVADIEERIAEVRDASDLPDKFVISATQVSATLDVARTVIRRAERVVAKMLHEKVIENQESLRYLNRASDLAFVLARLEEHLDGVPYMTISASDLE